MRAVTLVFAIASATRVARGHEPGAAGAPAPGEPAAHGRASEIRVDRRVELVSIAFRLAGADEYRRAARMPYTDDVDRAFAAFADHPAIATTRMLRERHAISTTHRCGWRSASTITTSWTRPATSSPTSRAGAASTSRATSPAGSRSVPPHATTI